MGTYSNYGPSSAKDATGWPPALLTWRGDALPLSLSSHVTPILQTPVALVQASVSQWSYTTIVANVPVG